MNKKEKLAYMAGVLDGDGSFSIMKKNGKKEGHSPLYYPIIQIANASKELIDFIKKEFGGLLHTRKAYMAKDGSPRRISYQWKLEKVNPCLPFLNEIIPYLVIKQERAIFLRDFINKNPFKRGCRKLTDEILQNREADYLKMKSFNAKRSNSENMPRKCKKDSENNLFWSYLAGLLDTDGSFSVKKEYNDKKMIHPKYSPQILLSMTDIKGIKKISENCIYGNVFTIKARTCLTGMCYRFAIGSRDQIIPFIEKVREFLLIKRQQADVLLKFCKQFTNTFYPREGIPQQELVFRESCYRQIKELNMGSINLG